MGSELHSHQSETHGFHLHTIQHDNIDTDTEHQSDAQLIDLEIDTNLAKVFKILVFIPFLIILLLRFIPDRSVVRLNYTTPFRKLFEKFHAPLRGPPASAFH